MAYNTKSILKDLDAKAIPQYYNVTADAYEVLKGRNGANFVEILGPNGETLSVVSNKLAVRATEIETLLNTLNAKDFATETKLEAARALLASLDSKDYSTETTLAALKAIFDSGDAKVTLSGSIDSIFSYATVNTLVSAGSIVSPYGASIVINDYKKLFCVAKEVSQTAHDFDILVYWSTSTGSYLYTDVYNTNHYSNLTRQFDVISHRVEIKLRNNDTVDHEYFIELGGVR